ncbi:opacity family porin [Actinobacillus delphinicola]|uniref:Porin opacity type n=1 Tax=Actinobacillus delphinicola TaxID=51161 RepID=A0A448TVJ3_9PAST|nr:opacity family porin [Actinobacillus delphinicola]VEJ09966.1 porin opacity type [Actinobacillus delphinicola]
MKKSLLATAILGLATATCANAALTTTGTPITSVAPDAQSGFPTDIPVMPYAQIDLGATYFNFSDNFTNKLFKSPITISSLPNTTAFSQRLTLGLDFQGDRIGFDFSNFGQVKYKIKLENPQGRVLADHFGDIKVNSYGFGLSYVHAMMLNSTVRPYIGARVGFTHVKTKFTPAENIPWTSGEYTDNHATIGALAGVEVDVARNVTLGLGAEYDQLWGNKLNALSGDAFMRVYF